MRLKKCLRTQAIADLEKRLLIVNRSIRDYNELTDGDT
jgi:hypothetical protein